jgi:hypothetical protein
MKHSTTLFALALLIVGLFWGCNSSPAQTSNGASNASGTPTSNTGNVTGSNATGGTPTSTSTTGGSNCAASGTQDCGGVCVDLYSNAQNCGSCGSPCPAGYGCSNAICTCAAGTQDCGAGCISLMTNPANCGACANACAAGQACTAGACACQAGLEDCGTGCVNTMADVNNCGACGTACGAQVCSQGACSDTCAAGLENCSGSCVNLETDTLNCGTCGTPCAGGSACTAGSCGCGEGQGDCNTDGTCEDLTADPLNCGACGNACPTGATCTAGTCTCAAGQELCGTACVAAGMCETSACGGKANSLMISDFESAEPNIVTGETGEFSGLWEGFGDEAGSWTAQAAVEAVTDAECGGQALHAAGQGFQSYVGIGFSLKGDDPMNINHLTDTYDASAWKGIRFKAKKGSGTLTPVRFNIATPFTEGAGSGGQCDEAAANNDCYNHPGRFLEGSKELTASWQTYHLCFDRDLYPQFLPSEMNNTQRENVASNILKVQFIFNKAIDPAVADPDTDPNSGEYPIATGFDFWIDDVEFTNDPCPEAVFASTGAKPFPQNQAPGSCTLAPNAAAFNTAISEYYAEWKQRFLNGDGGVFSPEDGRVISEGMGYGMLLAVSFGDRTAFDSMWGYVTNNLNCGGLMTWIGGGGCQGSATDGDADIAYALLLAGDKWPDGGYGAAGTSMVGAMDQDISGNRINPGSNWPGVNMNAYNPSYFTPAYYDDFGGAWPGIRTEGYNILQSCDAGFGSGSDGLVADWHDAGSGWAAASAESLGAQVVSDLCPPDCTLYAFDAARVPWRIGVDACLTGDSAATGYLNELIGHFAGLYQNGERIDLMRSAYRGSDGAAHANSVEMQASFIGPVGVGAMSVNATVYHRSFRTVLDILRSLRFNRTYYPATVGLLSLMEMTGNIPHR